MEEKLENAWNETDIIYGTLETSSIEIKASPLDASNIG